MPQIARAYGSAHANAAERAVGLIPPDDSVSATNQVGAHLSARRKIFLFPVVRDARWVVVDSDDPWHTANDDPVQSRRFARQLARFRADPRFERRFFEAGISVYQRRGPKPAG
jgi:hypothetical protein